MLRLGLLASGHAAGVGGGEAAGLALRDVPALCRSISGELGTQRAKKFAKSLEAHGGEERGANLELASAAAAAAVRRIAHVGMIIMIVNNAWRLMASCEGGEDWLGSSGRALDMVMRDGLSN